MPFHFPRRINDVPGSDMENEFNTPQRSDNGKKIPTNLNSSNKENEYISKSSANANIMGSNTKTTSTFNSLRFPKRSSELPTLESDSEEEDNIRNDNLNCAILNESFILSPAKNDLSDECGSTKNDSTKDTSSNNSFLSRFDKMALSGDEKPTAAFIDSSLNNVPNENRNVSAAAPGIIAGATKTDSAEDNEIPPDISIKGTVKRLASNPLPQHFSKQRTLATPLKTISTVGSTIPTTSEPQFVTPQIRSFSVQRSRATDLCSTNAQKTRSAMVNEFRSQKVLFQTPMSVARAPISCLSNDSISLSLCDTINESGCTPSTIEKTPQCGTKEVATTKSKKSLEDAFQEVEQYTRNEKAMSTTQEVSKTKLTVVAEATSSSNAAVTTSSGKETVLYINNYAYTIGRKLGCGGSSSVHLAMRKDCAKECALKIVDLRGDAATVEGYLNETKLLAKLQGNACVVALYDYQLLHKESKLFMVMEKGDSDLNKILQGYTTNLPLYVLMNYLYQMLQAVHYIHQNGVIHSDLKPANFLMVNGRLKLIDFGIASNIAIDSTSIIKSSQAGTFNYISPEALTDTSTGSSPMRNNLPKIKISTKSDVWSLGCILYLFLYNRTPFSHIKSIYAKISAISNPEPDIKYPEIPVYYPMMLVQMVRKCLQHNPKKRPSCAELLQYPFDMIIPVKHLEVRTNNATPAPTR